MKHAVKRSRKFFSQTLALVLALTIMMSTVIVSGLSLTVFAASNISGTIYLDVSGNSDWQGKTVVASFDNEVTQTAQFSGSGNVISVNVPSQASNANRMTLTAYPSDYPFTLASQAPANKYRIITKKDRSRNYCYAWNSVSNTSNATWPGQQMNSSGDYYYIDLDKKFEKCIFNNGSDGSKTGDLTVKYIENVAYYNAASFADSLTASVNISSLSGTQNLFVINSNNSVSVSKYHYTGTTIDAVTKTVYLYNSSWNSAYVTYDLSDVYQTTVAMTPQTNSETGVKYFKCDVPVGATIRFQSRQSSSAGGSSTLSIPSDNDPLYVMDSQNYWTTLANLPTDSTRIPNNFADNGSNIYGVTATYFDYMSDNEINYGYLNRASGRQDEPFNSYLNSAIEQYSRDNDIKTPLYFGNYPNKGDDSQYYRYKQKANNSNAFGGAFYRAIQGLTSNSLVNNQLYVPKKSGGAAESPLFNEAWLQGDNSKGKELAKVFDSYFPFRYETDSNGITTYKFDSSGGGTRDSSGNLSGNKSKSDNVYFTWDGKTPVAVNYGYGSDYTVKDGTNSGTGEFQVDGTGFGIFPFNNTSKTMTSTVSDGTTQTIPASDVICVVDNSGWGNVWCHAWGSSDIWFEAAKKDGNNYYFHKGQFPSTVSGYQFTHEKQNYDHQSANLSGFGKKYTNSNSKNWNSSTTYTDTLEITGGKTYTRTGNNDTDYGFGVRMDMDFRVPENGMLGKGTTYTVPSSEIWVKSNSQVYYYGYNSSGSNSGGLAALSKVSGVDGYYKIPSDKINTYKYYVLAYSSNWNEANNGKRYPADGVNKEISEYKGQAISFSSSGVSTRGTSVTVGATPVTFDYAGDDDLWVYISDDSGHSELVLDLGGAHKFTKGNINFNTMKATAETVDTNYNTQTTESPAVPTNEVWILNEGNYSNLYLKTWNKVDEYGNNYDYYVEPRGTIDYSYSDGSKQNFFRFRISDLDGAREFTINTQKASTTEESKNYELYYIDMNETPTPGYAFMKRVGGGATNTAVPVTKTITSPGGSNPGGGAVVSSFFGGQQLDPNKTYHMTVFYMERGLIESNLQVSFTMTPVTNNLLVDKEVQIPEINNTTIRNAIYENDTFGYTSSNASESTMSGKEYSYTQQSGDTVSMTLDGNGAFSLKDKESAYFVSQFKTGSNMTVNETTVNDKSILSERYDTSWVLYDGGNQINSGNSTSANFNLEGEDKDKNADLELAYTNTLKTGDLEITKAVTDKNKNIIDSDVDFTYTVLLDLKGGYNYKSYPLNYTVVTGGVENSYYTTDGTLSFSPKSTVLIENLPAGTRYKITETVPEGYTCSNNNREGKISTGKISVPFTNIQGEGEGEITVNKMLDNKNYTGSQFSFTLEGLPSAGDGYIDASGIKATADSVSSGEVTFNLKFSEVGKYRFKVTEDALDSSLIGYNRDNSTYYIEIAVNANSTTNILEISDTHYYSDDKFTKTIDDITFENTTEKGKITINKQNPAGGSIDAEFAVIRVNKDSGMTADMVKTIMSDNTTKNYVVAASGKTSGGKIEFDNLPIYQDGSKIYNIDDGGIDDGENYLNGEAVPQIYCVVEYKATSGYNLNSTPYYVTFPVKAGDEQLAEGYYKDSDGFVRETATDAYVFTQTFNYTNYPVVVPDASGDGMFGWIKLGLMIIAGAGVLTALYFGYNQINRKRRMARAEAHRR